MGVVGDRGLRGVEASPPLLRATARSLVVGDHQRDFLSRRLSHGGKWRPLRGRRQGGDKANPFDPEFTPTPKNGHSQKAKLLTSILPYLSGN